MQEKIIIIGGGISGITTALTLQLSGCDTTIYADRLVDDNSQPDPRFASLYPAASVIPHSVQTDRMGELFSESQKVFEILFDKGFPGMSIHRHYEIFEFEVQRPAYSRYLDNYMPINEIDPSFIPRRKNSPDLHGRAFDCFVAEWPVYIKELYETYRENGGRISQRKIEPNEISELPTDIIVNCSGVWSRRLFKDEAKAKIIRGHIIHALNRPRLKDEQGCISSYNYTPVKSVYATPDGRPCDVYFYPVDGKWLLGGSRQIGFLDDNGRWQGEESSQTMTVDNINLPRQIIELNRNILENTYGATLQSDGQLKSFIGYRFQREVEDTGLRLEKTEEYGKIVVHNYGHGGAGVTLSWGCALQAAKMLNGSTDAVKIGSILGRKRGQIFNR